MNTPFRFEVYEQIERRTLEDLKKRYHEALSSQFSVESMIANMEDHLAFLQQKVLELSREAKQSMQHLDEIALKSNPLSEVEYIDLLIESEKQEAKPGFQKRVKCYQDMKQKVLIMLKIKDTDIAIEAQKHNDDKWESFKFW